MNRPPSILVCFAVVEEVKPFRNFSFPNLNLQVLVSGMGVQNAERAVRTSIRQQRPDYVITSGFAGGLDPNLKLGDIVFDADAEWLPTLSRHLAGARQVSFHTAERVAITAAEKRSLWDKTRAHAVEMESGIIRRLSLESGIPSATIRVISDTADANLPLDFNQFMTPDMKLNWPKFAIKLATSPWKIPSLMKFQKETSFAANNLASALYQCLQRLAHPATSARA